MQQFIECDAHKRFSVFVAVDERGRATRPIRVEHNQRHCAEFLKQLPAKSGIAIESTGHWYWLATLLRNGTLPESWIPPGPLRDPCELLRTRVALHDLRNANRGRGYHTRWHKQDRTKSTHFVQISLTSERIMKRRAKHVAGKRALRTTWSGPRMNAGENAPVVGAVPMSASTIVVPANARLLRRLKLRG